MLTPEEEADLLEAQVEMRRGEFATAAEVEAVSLNIAREAALSKERPQQIDKALGYIAARSPDGAVSLIIPNRTCVEPAL
jgi:predicted Zn-dependent peptidase